MKIAFAIERFDALHGGAERYAWGLARWLVDNGHDLTIYAKDTSETELPGVRVRLLDLKGAGRSARRAQFAAALKHALAGQSYDVVQGFNHVRPCDVLRLGGGVHLAYEHYNALTGRGALERYAKLLAYRMLPHYREPRINERLQFADPHRHFIAVSRRVADDMIRYYPHCRERVHVIRNAPDLSAYNPEAAAAKRTDTRKDLGLNPQTLVFLFVSNNHRLKGLPRLISALALASPSLPDDFALLVVGRDNALPFERAAVRAGIGDNVRFCGTSYDLLGFYGAADALLHPAYYDACANVCLEAMACGLPVLTSRNNGASELMVDGVGSVLIDMPCTLETLQGAILQVADPAFRARAKEVQFERAREMPIENNYGRVLALYEEVVREKARRLESATG